MNEKEIIKLVNSNLPAIKENLLTKNELTEIKGVIEQYLDENLKGKDLNSLRYRKFKSCNENVGQGIWCDSISGYPIESMEWIKPYLDFFRQYVTEKSIKNRLENENLWVESRIQGEIQHLLIGEKGDSKGTKVHLIFDHKTGEIRIDKNDQSPSEVIKKAELVITTNSGNVITSTTEYYNNLAAEI